MSLPTLHLVPTPHDHTLVGYANAIRHLLSYRLVSPDEVAQARELVSYLGAVSQLDATGPLPDGWSPRAVASARETRGQLADMLALYDLSAERHALAEAQLAQAREDVAMLRGRLVDAAETNSRLTTRLNEAWTREDALVAELDATVTRCEELAGQRLAETFDLTMENSRADRDLQDVRQHLTAACAESLVLALAISDAMSGPEPQWRHRLREALAGASCGYGDWLALAREGNPLVLMPPDMPQPVHPVTLTSAQAAALAREHAAAQPAAPALWDLAEADDR